MGISRPRPGRPPKDESAWSYYTAPRKKQSRAIRLLALEAERRKWSILMAATLCGREIKAFTRTLSAPRPRLASVMEFAGALGYGVMVARALTNRLTDRDFDDVRSLIAGEIAIRRARLFTNATVASLAFQDGWRRWPENVRHNVCAAYVIANAGLDDEPVDEVLGLELGAINRVLRVADVGFDLHRFVADPDSIKAAKAEGIDWLLLMSDALGFSADDEAAIGRILGKYVARTGDGAGDWEIRSRARDAARKAYRAALGAAKRAS